MTENYPGAAPRRPSIAVTLSTASVYPASVDEAFSLAADLGYDGIEVMVFADPATQSADALRALINRHQIPVTSIHSPCLLISSRVWSSDPLVKLARSVDLAEQVGASVVVVHPPFVWQRRAAANFPAAVAELQSRTAVKIAVENMFPVTTGGGRVTINGYRPHWNPVSSGHKFYTLDTSHTAASGIDALELADQMGAGLAHLHLADGSGAPKDEHLVPGRGNQPCAELLERLARNNFPGSVCAEINTRGLSKAQRDDDIAQTLYFARLALDAR